MGTGGKKPKSRGNAYEYRVAKFFNDREGWDAKRVLLSGAVKHASDQLGKHDVTTRHITGIFLQIECKKTAESDSHQLKWEWIEKIDFSNDEFLVFAFGRSGHYVLTEKPIYDTLAPTIGVHLEAKGQRQYRLYKKELTDRRETVLFWEPHNKYYVITDLDTLINHLEKRGPLSTLDPVDVIKSSESIGELEDWFKDNHNRLTNYEKSLYYDKLYRLENGIDEISREYIVEAQWWRNTSDDFIMKCPHCESDITHQQLSEWKENRNNLA